MRESNFAFPAQNRACVCITSQLYDRRALDTNSPLPLLNSLTHLTYLTSTSPRIREILTCDGGLERLVRLLHDFCLSPPPPDNPSAIYGLSPPNIPRPPPSPVLNPKSFDRHAAYRFSLAFQCVVNVGVRGSEQIRSRVVQAGTLDVVGCVLEAWLASKGFAVGPSASASGQPRESREQRTLRRQMQSEQRQREQAQELARLLAMERRLAAIENVEDEDNRESSQERTVAATSDAETATSTDNSASVTPTGTGTPTSHVTVPGRDRSGTFVARRVWDHQELAGQDTRMAMAHAMSRHRTIRAGRPSGRDPIAASASTSRPDTETEDDGEPDGDGDVDMSSQDQDVDADENAPPPSALPQRSHVRRAVGIVADSPPPDTANVGPSESLDVGTLTGMDAHIIINTTAAEDGGMGLGGGMGMGTGVGGVDDGIVALDQNVNDDLAMGAPPGAPGAIDGTPRTRTNTLTINAPREGRQASHGGATGREELTPRAVLASLPLHTPVAVAVTVPPTTATTPAGLRQQPMATDRNAIQDSHFIPRGLADNMQALPQAGPTNPQHPPTTRHHHHRHGHHSSGAEENGPFREEDVLLSLQLLAYLSKYPHVRQAFYKQKVSFHPSTAQLMHTRTNPSSDDSSSYISSTPQSSSTASAPDASKKDSSFFKTITGRGKEKAITSFPQSDPPNGLNGALSTSNGKSPISPPRMTNVFSLVERFTFRPSPAESNLPNPPPFLPPEIQYWAGVIMRNACRKDESRGGIRQCANMLCGKWESFPREFAKCRRCRKAKYCGKECQSRAWSEGHRFWCSARDGDENGEGVSNHNSRSHGQVLLNDDGEATASGGDAGGSGSSRRGEHASSRAARRAERERENQRRSMAAVAAIANLPQGTHHRMVTSALRNAAVATRTQIPISNQTQTHSSATQTQFEQRGEPPTSAQHRQVNLWASEAEAQGSSHSPTSTDTGQAQTVLTPLVSLFTGNFGLETLGFPLNPRASPTASSSTSNVLTTTIPISNSGGRRRAGTLPSTQPHDPSMYSSRHAAYSSEHAPGSNQLTTTIEMRDIPLGYTSVIGRQQPHRNGSDDQDSAMTDGSSDGTGNAEHDLEGNMIYLSDGTIRQVRDDDEDEMVLG